MTEIIYPVDRLLANPRIFHAIANYLEGPDAQILKDSFYDMLEFHFTNAEDADDCDFEATEIAFRVIDSEGTVEITLDTGLTSVLKPVEGEVRAFITNDAQMAASSAIYQRIISAIEETNPDFTGNIALCSPPTPGNQYLRSEDGERFEGAFHLLTDPDREFDFTIDIVDVQGDILRATYRPSR
jgi:hypothetical protein